MSDAHQIRAYFFTFQVVGWADIFTRQVYRDIILESLTYCRKERGLNVFAYVIMSNHVHLILQSKQDDLSGTIRGFKKFHLEGNLPIKVTNLLTVIMHRQVLANPTKDLLLKIMLSIRSKPEYIGTVIESKRTNASETD